MANQEAVFKDFLLGAYKDIKQPDDYVQKQQPAPQDNSQAALGQPSPMAAMMGSNPLPQVPTMG